jgi:hypothetical protein
MHGLNDSVIKLDSVLNNYSDIEKDKILIFEKLGHTFSNPKVENAFSSFFKNLAKL